MISERSVEYVHDLKVVAMKVCLSVPASSGVESNRLHPPPLRSAKKMADRSGGYGQDLSVAEKTHKDIATTFRSWINPRVRALSSEGF